MKKIEKIIKKLRKEYGHLKPVVGHRDPYKVLISTMLSQRTRDENTKVASKELFKKYKNAKDLASAPVKEIEKLIKAVGFYKVKAKRIKQVSKDLLRKHKGKVPKNEEELIKLPGVGAKTAMCTLLYGYGIARIPVDVHVFVIAKRLGLTDRKTPDQAQEDIEESVPKKYWLEINNLFVKHGKEICKTHKPRCKLCPIKEHCKYFLQKP